MILFREDWKKYPNAIADVNTKNKSFLRFSALLKNMGVENHMFPLQLHNPELLGIDPFSADLTIEQMGLISIECKQNFFYYIREIARVPAVAGSDATPFRANRGNFSLFWLFFNHVTVFLIQIRQTGKSFSTDTLMNYLLNVRCTGTEINLLTKDDTLRSSNIERMKAIEAELPFYLKQRTKSDIGNTEELTVKALSNRYRGHLPSKSPKQALNVGRGLSSPIFQIDEGAFLYNIGISLPAALAAGTAMRDIARRNNEPYGTIITTTAGKKDDRDGKYIYEELMKSAIWTEKFYDCENLEHLEEMVRKNSSGGYLRVNCTFNHRQLGYTDAWLKQAIEDAMVSGDDARRDFFNIWTSGTQSSPISPELADQIRNGEVQDYYNEVSKNGYITRWYIDQNQISQYLDTIPHVLALDTSDAGGRDDISLILLNATTGETTAAGNYNETNLIEFADYLFSWFVRFPKIVGIIERRSSGATIMDYLLLHMEQSGMDPFKRLFNRVVNDHQEFPERFQEIQTASSRRTNNTYVKYKKHFGFSTSGSGLTSRTDLYSNTFNLATRTIGASIKDSKTINQLLSLIIKNGRIDHDVGDHDDMVIAWLLAFFFLTKASNLSYYGIDTRSILTNVKKQDNTQESEEELRERYFQDRLREQIQIVYGELENTRDNFLAMKLERELIYLSNQLKLRDTEVFSAQQLIDNLREARNRDYRRY